MKKLLLGLVAVLAGANSYAATCSSISRTNVAANSVLTSSEYNASLNTAYTALNSFDGGCVATGTLEYDALNTTQFAAVLNGVKEGCVVTASDSNTISVDRCMWGVNGTFGRTTTATTVTWGCSGCSSETTSTLYYVYIATGSSGTTLTLKILTGAPNADGYDASGNRVIGKFYNNASSNIIAPQSVVNGNVFNDLIIARTSITNSGTPTVSTQSSTNAATWISSLTDNSTGDTSIVILSGIFSATPSCTCIVAGDPASESFMCQRSLSTAPSNVVYRLSTKNDANSAADRNFDVICVGPGY